MKCTEPIPAADNKPCGRECYKQRSENDPSRFYWMCPTHGLEKLLSEPYDEKELQEEKTKEKKS